MIDSATVVPDAFIATATALGGTTRTRREAVALYSLGPPPTTLSHMLDRPATPADVGAYHRELTLRAAGVRAYPGINGTLLALRPHLPMAVCTGASTHAAQILLGAAGLDHHFQVVVGDDLVEAPQPDPAGIHLACSELGLRTAACAYLGDAPSDLQAAAASGALALAASRTSRDVRVKSSNLWRAD